MTEQKSKTLRNRVIKIRVSDVEFSELNKRKTETQLATWMRKHCLNASKQRSTTVQKCDPNLLRQLAGIGNNLNQIARRTNSDAKAEILQSLISIERELEKLNDQYCS